MPCCMLTILLLMLVPEKTFYIKYNIFQKSNQSRGSTLIIRVNHLLGGQGPDFVHFLDSEFEQQNC